MSKFATVTSILFRRLEISPDESHQSEKEDVPNKESLDCNGLWAALAFVLFMPGMIAGYVLLLTHSGRSDYYMTPANDMFVSIWYEARIASLLMGSFAVLIGITAS